MEITYHIQEEPLAKLPELVHIPIRFTVQTIFEIEGDDPATAVLSERPVARPWVKDYDAILGEGPAHWAGWWDISNWGLLTATDETGRRVGACVLAYRTDGVNKLEGRDDLVVLWDIRVHPDWRGRGIGRALFQAAGQWATARQATQLKIETQNINTAACRFYQKQGCTLWAINRAAYVAFPDEIELIWCLALGPASK